jgi:thiol:disulfide interchange protein DsbA
MHTRSSPAAFTTVGLLGALLALTALFTPHNAQAQMLWQQGVHYELISSPTQPTTPGKVEVTEIFSYGCPFCFRALDVVDQLKASLPAYVQMTYVHASFNSAEAWPVFQRGYLTAQALGIADANHEAMFKAIWETGELPLINPTTQQLVNTLPTVADLARFYAKRSKVTEAQFIKLAQSPQIDAAVKNSDDLVKRWQIGGTPGFVVNGKYRTGRGLKSYDDLIKVVNYLVALERARAGG